MSIASTRHCSSLSIDSSPPPPHHRLHPSSIFLPFPNSPSTLPLLTVAKHHLKPPLNKFPPAAAAAAAANANRLSHTSDGIGERAVRAVPGQLGLDELLSVGEVLCVAPPVAYSLGCLLSFALPAVSRRFQPCLGSKVFALQYVLLVGALAIGSLIRWRQWRRICRVDKNVSGVNLVERIEKVEEDLRSSATIVRVLSRQLEKLGVRFRVTRRTIKEPVAETAALAQKNSEATRALAIQVDILEKELGEIQKVLLAMQEQQQKQLELILAIGKASRLLDPKRDSPVDQSSFDTGSSVPEKRKTEELETTQ